MTDRVYPSKPNGAATIGTTANGTAAAANIPRAFPATKSQFNNNPNRHPYRPTPNTRRGRRGCFCLCCFWSILIFLILLLLAAIAGCVFYVLYSPHRPSFSVNALRITQFNLTTAPVDDATHLAAAVNLSISVKNPNKKVIFFYDLISITAETSSNNNVVISNGSFPNFPSYTGNTTIIRSVLSTPISSQVVDADSVKSLQSDLKKKSGLPLKIVMDTKVVVKMDAVKTKKIGIRITCDGIHGGLPKGNTTEVASTADSNCKVDLRIKIWKWTF